jgi:hypothetical protein
MTKTPASKLEIEEAIRKKAKAALWQRGNLQYLLHATQLKILDKLASTKSRKFMMLCSRRIGKTYLLCTKAIQLCLQKPNARVLFVAPFSKDAQEISTDTMVQILADCPDELRPEWKGQTKELVFRNGSIIRVKGVNGEHAQYLRGGAADLILLDEIGLIDDLEHVIQDICMPMVLTTGGQIIMATTPPRSPGHESARQFELLMGKGAASVFTLLDAPHVDSDTKIEFLCEAGETPDNARKCIVGYKGSHNERIQGWPVGTTARREYYCEFVTDASSAVVPEFTKEREATIVQEAVMPDYYDAYVALDPGFKDRTGILFAYWDFANYRLVVQDECLLDQANTQTIAAAVQVKERALWGTKKPYMRVADVDLRLIADLQGMHKLNFIPTRKEDSLGAVNLMRNMVQSGQIVINPRCTNLIRQLRNATWNNKATDFAQGGKVEGHYDLVAAFKYLCRNVIKEHNPYPDHFYAQGGRFGPPAGAYVSFKGKKAKGPGLFGDTPLGKRLNSKKKWNE